MHRSLPAAVVIAFSAAPAGGFEIISVNIYSLKEQTSIPVPASLTPSSGSFVVQYPEPNAENAFLSGVPGGQATVLNDAPTWRDTLDEVMSSTWLALDRYGPRGSSGTSAYGRGWFRTRTNPISGVTVHVPEWNTLLADSESGLAVNGTLGDPVNGDGLSPGFFTPGFGIAWQSTTGRAASARTDVNGVMKNSIFIGHLVLTDPDAGVAGDPLIVFIDPDGPGPTDAMQAMLPLDGSYGREIIEFSPGTPSPLGRVIPLQLEYERTTFTNSLGTFTALDMYLVPAPAGVVPFVALSLFFRCRRPEPSGAHPGGPMTLVPIETEQGSPMTRAPCVGVVLGVFCVAAHTCAAGHFTLAQAAVLPGGSVIPSSGAFVTQYAEPGLENYFVHNGVTITSAGLDWRDSLDAIMATSWVALDRYGPKGRDGSSPYGTGWKGVKPVMPIGSTVHVPEGTIPFAGGGTEPFGFVANGEGGDIDGDGLSPGLFGGEHGIDWHFGAGIARDSEPVLVNGSTRPAFFLGHFVLSDPEARLVGGPVFINSVGHDRYLPLDGTADAAGFRLEFERTTFTNSLGTFTALDMYVVPAPGVGVCWLWPSLCRRRRR